jgi:hypothetical protein
VRKLPDDQGNEEMIMASEARDLHIHLTAQPGTTVHVTVAGDTVTVVSDDAEPTASALTATASPEDVLEAAIQRLESSGASPNVRAAADGLRAMGYELKLATTNRPGRRPENYLRIMDPHYRAHGMGVLTPSLFSFTRQIDRDTLVGLPDARERGSSVVFSHVESAQPGLDAARRIKN